MSMLDINFSQNWNGGKLDNIYFTTLRPHSPRAYRTGRQYRILLKGELKKEVVCTGLVTMKLQDLTEYHAGLDTGYDKARTVDMIKKMYSKVPEKCQDDSLFDFLLLKTTKTY